MLHLQNGRSTEKNGTKKACIDSVSHGVEYVEWAVNIDC